MAESSTPPRPTKELKILQTSLPLSENPKIKLPDPSMCIIVEDFSSNLPQELDSVPPNINSFEIPKAPNKPILGETQNTIETSIESAIVRGLNKGFGSPIKHKISQPRAHFPSVEPKIH